MMKTQMSFYLLIGLFILSGCTKTRKLSPSHPAAEHGFPLQKGDYWIYQVTDFEKNTVDTVTVSVASALGMADGADTLAILQVSWPKKKDTAYVSVTADTVTIFAGPNRTRMINALIFPLNRNYDPLHLTPPLDPLMSQQKLSSFKSLVRQDSEEKQLTSFRIKKVFGVLFNCLELPYVRVVIDDVAPGVGIIKESLGRQKKLSGKVPIEVLQTWVLLRFHLTEPGQPAL